MMKRLRFGVIGCGGVSTFFHLPSLRRCSNVDLVAVADLDEGHARSVARRFKVPEAYSDYHSMVSRVDAALVATPNSTHADITCDLLERGVHVLCEKPMATTLPDIERMQYSARRNKVRLMAGQSMRFGPHITLLKQIVDNDLIGDLQLICAALGGPYRDGVHRTDFRRQKALSGGGVLMDLGVHLIDFTLWLTGDTVKHVVYHGSAAPGWEVESDAEIGIELTSGAWASLHCSLSYAPERTLTVKGSAGWVQAGAYDPTKVILVSKRARICRRDGLQQIIVPNAMSEYDRQIEHFCTAVLSGADFLVKDYEIQRSMHVIQQCYAAATIPGVS